MAKTQLEFSDQDFYDAYAMVNPLCAKHGCGKLRQCVHRFYTGMKFIGAREKLGMSHEDALAYAKEQAEKLHGE